MIDTKLLESEYKYLKEQFPLVSMVEPTLYRGMIRCERGHVKDLAKQGVWPFTEYVKWQSFELELDSAHPFKPPIVTWLSEIPHPNIIPNQRGQVCVSVLGENWKPDTKLAAIINSLYFLLSDPNPDSTYPNPKCISAAKVCKSHSFPKRRVEAKKEAEKPPIQINIHKPIHNSTGQIMVSSSELDSYHSDESAAPMAERQHQAREAYDQHNIQRYPQPTPRYDERDVEENQIPVEEQVTRLVSAYNEGRISKDIFELNLGRLRDAANNDYNRSDTNQRETHAENYEHTHQRSQQPRILQNIPPPPPDYEEDIYEERDTRRYPPPPPPEEAPPDPPDGILRLRCPSCNNICYFQRIMANQQIECPHCGVSGTI